MKLINSVAIAFFLTVGISAAPINIDNNVSQIHCELPKNDQIKLVARGNTSSKPKPKSQPQPHPQPQPKQPSRSYAKRSFAQRYPHQDQSYRPSSKREAALKKPLHSRRYNV